MNEFKIKKRTIVSVVFGVFALIMAISIGGNAFEDVPAGKYQVKQEWVTGRMDAKMTPGVWKQFGDIIEMPKARTFYGTADNDGDGDTNQDNSVTVRFADGSEANISFTARAEMPRTKDEAIALVRDYAFRSYSEVENKLLLPVFRRSLRSTATLMTARESYSEKRNDFLTYTWDQVLNGPYLTKAVEKTIVDPLSGEEVTRNFQEIVLDESGRPTYGPNPLEGKGITLDNFEIKDFDYLGKVNEQIVTQQEAMMNIATAKAKAQEAEQEKIRIAAVGKAAVEKAKYEKEVEKIEAVTVALKDKEVAETKAAQELEVAKLARMAAEETKQKEILLGQGEAERKRLNMTGAALKKELIAAMVQMNADNANALSRRPVPSTYFAGTGGDGMSSSYDDDMVRQLKLLNLQTIKALGMGDDMRAVTK